MPYGDRNADAHTHTKNKVLGYFAILIWNKTRFSYLTSTV